MSLIAHGAALFVLCTLLALSEGFSPIAPLCLPHASPHTVAFRQRMSHLVACANNVSVSVRIKAPSVVTEPAAASTVDTNSTDTTISVTVKAPKGDAAALASVAATPQKPVGGASALAGLGADISAAPPPPQQPPPSDPVEMYMNSLGGMKTVDKYLLGAAMMGDEEKMQESLDNGADPTVADPSGRTCLHLCAGLGLPPVVDMLVELGNDVDKADKDGLTPLHMAVGYQRPNTVLKLLELGAEIDVKDAKQNRTPLMLAEELLEQTNRQEDDGPLAKLRGKKKNNENLIKIWRTLKAVDQEESEPEPQQESQPPPSLG